MSEAIPPTLPGWDFDDGNVIVRPLAGFATATFAGMMGVVRLEFLRTLASGERPESVQLGMTPEQARELGVAILLMADHLDRQSVPSKSDRN